MGPARVEASPWRVVERRPNGFLAVAAWRRHKTYDLSLLSCSI